MIIIIERSQCKHLYILEELAHLRVSEDRIETASLGISFVTSFTHMILFTCM